MFFPLRGLPKRLRTAVLSYPDQPERLNLTRQWTIPEQEQLDLGGLHVKVRRRKPGPEDLEFIVYAMYTRERRGPANQCVRRMGQVWFEGELAVVRVDSGSGEVAGVRAIDLRGARLAALK